MWSRGSAVTARLYATVLKESQAEEGASYDILLSEIFER